MSNNPKGFDGGNFSSGLAQDTREELMSMVNTLAQDLLPQRFQYPLSKFTHYFAPFFLGVHKVPQGQNLHASWQAEVGSMHAEVEIVDDNTRQVVFVVPALLSIDGLNLAESAQFSPTRFNEIKNRAEQEGRNFPTEANDQYRMNNAKKMEHIFSFNRLSRDNAAKWVAIFNYYNIPVPHDANNNPAVPNVSSGNTGSLQFDFTSDL